MIPRFGLEKAVTLSANDANADATPPIPWALHDGTDEWEFPDAEEIVAHLVPVVAVVWWGGLPKSYKSLLLLYVCLALACRRTAVAKHFNILRYPKILYVSREDGGARLKQRRKDILAAWGVKPERGAIRFLIKDRVDLMDPTHIAWLRETCVREEIAVVALDTWTRLSPTADPMNAQDQAALADIVAKLAEDISGTIIVVDHSRKNRPDREPLSSADIFGPMQKWAAAEHIVMLSKVSPQRLEVFIEGKDADDARFFLAVSPRESGEEKFTYAGTVQEIADAQREKGDQNREAVYAAAAGARTPVSVAEVVNALTARGGALAQDTVKRHLAALVKSGRLRTEGKGKAVRYSAPPAQDPLL